MLFDNSTTQTFLQGIFRALQKYAGLVYSIRLAERAALRTDNGPCAGQPDARGTAGWACAREHSFAASISIPVSSLLCLARPYGATRRFGSSD